MIKKLSKASEISRQAKCARTVRLILAVYILIIMIFQLFAFEDFPKMLDIFGIGQVGQYLLAIVLVLVELAALPFLLGMNIRESILNFSYASGVATVVLLSIIEVAAFTAGNTAIFGATVEMPVGSWSLFFLAALWLLVVWSSYYLMTSKYRERAK